MLKAAIFAGALIAIGSVSGAQASQYGQPSCDWNCNYQHPSNAERKTNAGVADMQERKRKGYYDQWHVNNYVTHGDTYIDDALVCSQSTSGSAAATESGGSANATNFGPVAAGQKCVVVEGPQGGPQ